MSSCKYDLSLLELIWRQRWSSVERRTRAHPYEMNLEHKGLLALHWACCNDPPASTLRLMLQQQNARYALIKDINGQTPLVLLLATSSSDEELNIESVRAFCQLAPECVSICDNFGRTPLHYLCENFQQESLSDLTIAQFFLGVDPSLALCTNCDGETALDRLWKSYGGCTNSNEFADFYFLAMAQLLLDSAFPETEGGSFLHQLVSYPECRDFLLLYIIEWRPNWLENTDLLGNNALHRAILKGCNASIVRTLVEHKPSLVRQQNLVGLLPIQLASHWTGQAFEILLQGYPQTVENLCLSDGCYAQLLGNAREPQTVFALLRNKPSLIKPASLYNTG